MGCLDARMVHTFTTAGMLVDPSGTGASGEMHFDAPATAANVGAWMVINDGRGGVAWSEKWIVVKGPS